MAREKPTLQSLLDEGCQCKTPLGSDGTEDHWGQRDIPNGLVLIEKSASGFCVVAPCLNHALTYMECWPSARAFSYAGYEALTEEEFQQTKPKKRVTKAKTRQLEHRTETMDDNLTSSRKQWEAIFGEPDKTTTGLVCKGVLVVNGSNYRDYIGSKVKVISTQSGARGAENAIGTLVPDDTHSENGCLNVGPKVKVEHKGEGQGMSHRIGQVWALGLKNVKLEILNLPAYLPKPLVSKAVQKKIDKMYGQSPAIKKVYFGDYKAEKPEDFELTGEFRIPEFKEPYLLGSGLLIRNDTMGYSEEHLIARLICTPDDKYPKSKELQVVQMYGTKDPKIRGVAELSSLRGFKAEDFEFTGEFRKPKKGEHSLSTVFNVVLNSFDKRYDRLILKKRA